MISNFIFDASTIDILIKLGFALLFGILIGTERIISHKAAGMRTYALVSMGAALFVIISELIIQKYALLGMNVGDPLQMPSMIISGIGFMGAGIIIFRDTSITGLTTASGLWVAAGIGMACGAGLFGPAFIATILTLFVFIVLWQVEQGIKKIALKPDDKHPDNTHF